MNDKQRIVVATIAGFGLILFSTIVAVNAQWVVDGMTGGTRLALQYTWVLAPLLFGIMVFWFTFLVYIDWSSKLKLSINELRVKIALRLFLGVSSLGLMLLSMALVPILSGMMDIGGPELPDTDNWKPFSALWGALGIFSILCFVSATWTAFERYDRLGAVA